MATVAPIPGTPSRVSEQRGIQSIEVGGALLKALAACGSPMMLKDLAASAAMPAAKAHPYLVSFVKLGLVEQDPLTGRYRLGPFALQLGLSALRGLDPVRIAIDQAALLAEATRLSIAVAVWGNFGPTVIHIEEGAQPLHVNMRPGTVLMPLLLSATGRVFAAYMPGRIVDAIIQRETQASTQPSAAGDTGSGAGTLPPSEPAASIASLGQNRHAISPEQAQAWLREIRERRLARAIGSPIPGINAFSVPVHDVSGQLALAITAIGTDDVLDVRWSSPIAQQLLACAHLIEYRLGRQPA